MSAIWLREVFIASTGAPSRYSMLTGVHGSRDNLAILPPNTPLSISTDILTLPKLFQQAGYATAVVRKWHLGIGAKGVPTDWNGVTDWTLQKMGDGERTRRGEKTMLEAYHGKRCFSDRGVEPGSEKGG